MTLRPSAFLQKFWMRKILEFLVRNHFETILGNVTWARTRNFLTPGSKLPGGSDIKRGKRDTPGFQRVNRFSSGRVSRTVTEIHFSSETNHLREKRDSHHGTVSAVDRARVYLMVPAQIPATR